MTRLMGCTSSASNGQPTHHLLHVNLAHVQRRYVIAFANGGETAAKFRNIKVTFTLAVDYRKL